MTAITLTRKATKAAAILFTGKNGADVVQFVRDAGEAARNGGTYVTITTDIYSTRVKKGEYVVLDSDGLLKTYNQEALDKLFRRYPATRKAGV